MAMSDLAPPAVLPQDAPGTPVLTLPAAVTQSFAHRAMRAAHLGALQG
jgi:hypothetical protein